MTWITLQVSSGIAHNGTAYQLNGPVDAPVVALIHGLGLSRHLWDNYIPKLSEKYRVLTYDLYGHGQSAPPPKTASLTVYSDQLADLMLELDIAKAHVVGFSIGGMINRRFALDHGELLHSLMILNSPHDRGEDAQVMVEDRAAKVAEQGPLATMDSALKRWFTPIFHQSNPEVLQLVCDWREQVEPTSYAQAAWVLAAGVRELIKPKLPISVPTLVMTCENDTGSTPAMSHAIAAQIENAETLIIPELQHLGVLETPDVFATLILDFLERTL